MGKLGFGHICALSAAFSQDLRSSKRLIGAIAQIQTFSDGTILDNGGHLSLDQQVVKMSEHRNVGFGNNNLTTRCSQKFGVFSKKGGFGVCCGKVGLGHSTPLEHRNVGFGNNNLTKFGVFSKKGGFGVCCGEVGLGHSTPLDFRGSKRLGGAVMTQIRTFSSEPTLDNDGNLSSGHGCRLLIERTVAILLKRAIYDRNELDEGPPKLPSAEDLLDQIPEDFFNQPNAPLPILALYAHVWKDGMQSFLLQSGLEYPEFTTDLPVYQHLVLTYMLDESMKGTCGIHGMWPSNKTKGQLVSLKSDLHVDKETQNLIRYKALNDPGIDVREKYWLPFEGSKLTFWEHEFKSHNIYEDFFLFPSYFKDVSLTSANFLQENGPNSLPALLKCYKETLASLCKKEPVSTDTGLELLRLLALRYFRRSISITNREYRKENGDFVYYLEFGFLFNPSYQFTGHVSRGKSKSKVLQI